MNKHLLPVHDKPMIYYPLSMLMLAGLREVVIVSTPDAIPSIERLLGDGSHLGMRLAYVPQAEPKGIAHGLRLVRRVLADGPCCVVLGDNILFGDGLTALLRSCASAAPGARIFACRVRDPRPYGVIELDAHGNAVAIEEKPQRPRSPYVVPGVYCYGGDVWDDLERLPPGARGEYDMPDLLRVFLQRSALRVEKLGRGITWMDAGTFEGLEAASTFIRTVEQRQDTKVACLEEIAHHQGWIDRAAVERAAEQLGACPYGNYLRDLVATGGTR